MIARIEELTINAWPALHTLLYDGWVLRFASGYTRRANSVYPLYPSMLDTRQKIVVCEEAYRAQGLRPVFKLTAAARPPDLDAVLAERGYEREAPTIVQIAGLAALPLPAPGPTTLVPAVSDEWLAAFCRLSKVDERHRPTMRAMLSSIGPARAFAALRVAGETVACGLVVVENGFAGLHDIVTHPAHRKQGYGRAVVNDLLRWARGQGAHTGWLAVMADNAPALRLYGKIGFEEQYQYWYRVGRAA